MSDVTRLISATLASMQETFDAKTAPVLESICQTVKNALERGNKLLICGNGGSAADAQHIAAEFIARFKKERKSFPAIALTTDTSILTAVGNDYSFEDIFSRQIEGLGNEGDVLIGISTSGNSKNVLRAMATAKQKGLTTIGFSGQGGGRLASCCDILFTTADKNTPHVQAAHIVALHAMCEVVENSLCA